MTVYTFRLDGIPNIPTDKPHVSIMPTLKVEASSWEEAEAKLVVPEGARAERYRTDERLPDEEVLSDEYRALIKARMEAGETYEQACILNRP